jgi:glucose-6-phosphate 1-dehydrogenase
MRDSTYTWKGGFCIEVSPVPNTIVIFGASGDLAHRKLLPALFQLYNRNLFHEKSRIVGYARTEMNDDSFRDKVKESLKESVKQIDEKKLNEFLKKIFYTHGGYDDMPAYKKLSEKLDDLDCKNCMATGRIFYLSTPANLYALIVKTLGDSGLVYEHEGGIPWRHVVIEKPFGKDLESSRKLDRELRSQLKERQIYRIDHYLGKETVQNILMLRFANRIFEPIWNNHYIDHVQITVAESIGVGHRAGFYDQTGLLRDMFQNHMMEMLCLVAMETPSSFKADSVRNEKFKLLNSIRPFDLKTLDRNVIRAQYAPGNFQGEKIPGYLEEENINPLSNTETYVCAKLMIDNWRWQGVPFYMRSGKRLPKRVSEIAITFKKIPHSIFDPIRAEDLAPNTLVLNVQPEEGLALTIQAKQPGPKLCMGSLTMDFKYADIIEGEKPEAYERLLLDCMLGDQTLFIRSDTIDISWQLLTPVLNAWEESPIRPETGYLHTYPAGSWGPEEANEMMAENGLVWRAP